MNKFQYQKGFTLIELLVVIAIIGILASVILSSLNTARSKARDAQRMSDIKQLVNAIEMYYSDNGFYPLCSGTGWSDVCSTTTITNWTNLSTLKVSPTYISNISKDPLNIDGQYGYYYIRGRKFDGSTFIYNASDQNYVIGTRLENSSSTMYNYGGPMNFLKYN